MTEFTLWDILRNLLLATRWTIVLSLVSFVCGGLVGLLLLFARIITGKALRTVARCYIEGSLKGATTMHPNPADEAASAEFVF